MGSGRSLRGDLILENMDPSNGPSEYSDDQLEDILVRVTTVVSGMRVKTEFQA